jgi:hypothetical protein
LNLDEVHQVIQDAFAWWDYHLYQFTLGAPSLWPGPKPDETFVCHYNMSIHQDEEQAPFAFEYRLDEMISEPGDILYYLYDYGDNWQLEITLETVLPGSAGSPAAAFVAGERAAPPEDCGHLVNSDDLALVLPNPSRCDSDKIRTSLQKSYYFLRTHGYPLDALQILLFLAFRSGSDTLGQNHVKLSGWTPSEKDIAEALSPYLWFLSRAAEGGIQLTAAGYLKPADVSEVAPLIPEAARWLHISPSRREMDLLPVMQLREYMVRPLGLLRKVHGKLYLTKNGEAVKGNAVALFDHMATKLAPSFPTSDRNNFTKLANNYLLVYAGAVDGGTIPLGVIATHLTDDRFTTATGGPIEWHHVLNAEGAITRLLRSIGNPADKPFIPSDQEHNEPISPVASALARAALSRSHDKRAARVR